MKRILKDCLREPIVYAAKQYNLVSKCTHILHIKTTRNVSNNSSFCIICDRLQIEWYTLTCTQQLKSIVIVYDDEFANDNLSLSNTVKIRQYYNLLRLPKLEYVCMVYSMFHTAFLLCGKLFKKRLLQAYQSTPCDHRFYINKLIFVL